MPFIGIKLIDLMLVACGLRSEENHVARIASCRCDVCRADAPDRRGLSAAVTAIAQVAFPHQANGSLIVQNDKLVGSELIGQAFDDPNYFWGRPSATIARFRTTQRLDRLQLRADQSGQFEAVKARVEAIRKAHPDQTGPVPVDLVTASGSGLDPHISPAAAEYQVSRVAAARGLTRRTGSRAGRSTPKAARSACWASRASTC